MEIRLLGDQRIVGGPDRGERPSSRCLALLAYLVLNAEAPQPRSHLAGLFWPGSADGQARTNLRRELHQLRNLLDGDPSLVVEPTTLLWRDAQSCRVDVRAFRIERSVALAARDPAIALRHAEAALAEYRGELLPGSYDEWVLAHREELRRECVEVCDLALAGCQVAGDTARAAQHARARIQLEPLEEAGYRALMHLQAAAGDLGAAIATYHRCASVLEQELGVRPGPQTVQLVEQLLGRSDRVARSGAPGLVGRGPERVAMTARWRRAVAGEPGLLVVAGEPGVGKSRLVAELAAVAGAEGAVVATSRCFAFSGRAPLAPVAEWLGSRGLAEGVGRLDRTWRREVERLLGTETGPREGAREADAAGQAMADAWRRRHFAEGLAQAVLAVGRPTLLVLDDLQWCDEETAGWLGFLLGVAHSAPVLVATTARPVELDAATGVAATLHALRAAGWVTDLALGPLDQAGTGELAASMLGRPLTGQEVSVLHATTAGYPLFVVEAARLAERAGADTLPEDDVQTVLRHRLEQASPAAQEVAGLAAAFGRDVSLDLLTEAGDLAPEVLVDAVDELWRRRILRERRGTYDFTHDTMREAAYAAVGPARRWLLHRRLAQGLELLHAGRLDDVAAQLADQYERAGRADRAQHYLERAARVAAAVFAHVEAVRLHRRSLRLLARQPPGPDRDRRELAVLQAMSAPLNAVQGYASHELQVVLERSVELSERLGLPEAQLRGLVGLFSVRFVQGRTAHAYRTSTRALALADADPAVAGHAHFAIAGSAVSLGKLDEAIEHFDLATRLAGEELALVGIRTEVHARAWSAHAHWLLGAESEASARADDAVAAGRAVQHPYSLAVALAYAGVTHQLRGDATAMAAAITELTRLCRRYDFAYYCEWAGVLGGWAEGGPGGIRRIENAIARLRNQGALARMPYWLSLLAETQVRAGHAAAAKATLDAAQASAERNSDYWWLPEVLRLRAAVSHPPSAEPLLRRAVGLATEQHSRTLAARSRAALDHLESLHPA